jgi:hypothetical protein
MALWLSGAALLACFVLSLMFAQERILNTDSSAFFFNLVNSEWPSVAEQRYSAAIPQFLPYVFLKLGASLKTILYVFSASYIVLYALVFGLIQFVLVQAKAAIALVLSLLLGVAHSFYHPVTETHQAIAWSILFYACLGSNQTKIIVILLGVLSFTLAIFSHPAAVFMLAFSLAWHIIETRKFRKIIPYLGILGLAIFSVLRSKLNEGNYDAAQYNNLYEALSNYRLFFKWNSISFLIQRPQLYVWPILLTLLSIAYFWQQKSFLKIVGLIFAAIGFTALAAATFYHGDSQMMMEKAYMPTFTMIAIASSSMFFGDNVIAKFVLLFLTAFYAFTLWQINLVGYKEFRPRLLAIDKLVEKSIQLKQYKLVAKQETAPAIWRGYWWATAADVLMRSTIENGTSITLYLYQENETLEYAQQPEAFLYTNWWRDRKVSELNPRFFKFSNNPYDSKNLSTYE